MSKIRFVLKAREGLVQQKRQVTRGGKTYTTTVWVKPNKKQGGDQKQEQSSSTDDIRPTTMVFPKELDSLESDIADTYNTLAKKANAGDSEARTKATRLADAHKLLLKLDKDIRNKETAFSGDTLAVVRAIHKAQFHHIKSILDSVTSSKLGEITNRPVYDTIKAIGQIKGPDEDTLKKIESALWNKYKENSNAGGLSGFNLNKYIRG